VLEAPNEEEIFPRFEGCDDPPRFVDIRNDRNALSGKFLPEDWLFLRADDRDRIGRWSQLNLILAVSDAFARLSSSRASRLALRSM